MKTVRGSKHKQFGKKVKMVKFIYLTSKAYYQKLFQLIKKNETKILGGADEIFLKVSIVNNNEQNWGKNIVVSISEGYIFIQDQLDFMSTKTNFMSTKTKFMSTNTKKKN